MRTPRVKLVPPRLPASHVPRPALERLLEEAERRRLTSIVAGPGFGKSTLAASVALERGWDWYLVDGGDRSLVSFARGLADALALPVGDDAFAGGSGTARAEDLAALLAGTLENASELERVLVLDDVHELGSGAAPSCSRTWSGRHRRSSISFCARATSRPFRSTASGARGKYSTSTRRCSPSPGKRSPEWSAASSETSSAGRSTT